MKKWADLNLLVQGGHLYWAFPFSKYSLPLWLMLIAVLAPALPANIRIYKRGTNSLAYFRHWQIKKFYDIDTRIQLFWAETRE